MNPLIIEGVRLFGAAAMAAAKGVPITALPAAQLARLGLMRAPLLGLGPLAGAFATGVACAFLFNPSGRAWLKEKGSHAMQWARQMREANSDEDGSLERASELSKENGVYVS